MSTSRRVIHYHHARLDRNDAVGVAYPFIGHIVIDDRLRGRVHLNTVVHECLHIARPEASESWVRRWACSMTRVLWEMGYRCAQSGRGKAGAGRGMSSMPPSATTRQRAVSAPKKAKSV